MIGNDGSTVTLFLKGNLGGRAYGGSSYEESEIKRYVEGLTGEDQLLAGISSAISGVPTLPNEATANGLSNPKKYAETSSFYAWWIGGSTTEGEPACMLYYNEPCEIISRDVYTSNMGEEENSILVRPALKLNLSKVTFDADTNTFTLKPAHTHDFTYTGSGDAAFTNLLTKSGNGTVSCASGNTDVETVNSESGEVTIVGVDEATARPFTSRSLRQTIQITPALRP